MGEQTITPEKARVLIVEDDPSNQLVAQKLLLLAGVLRENISVVDGDPLPFIQDTLGWDVDLILLDLHLPDKDGFAILAEIRAEPKLAAVKVAALTANVMASNVDQAEEAGFDGFISKPVDGPRFPDWIRRLLAGESVWVIEW